MPRIRGQITGSGFISRSPRLLLCELDDNPGAYPTILRDGDSTRTGALVTSFDDGSTIIFSENGSPVFPSMLPSGSSFNSQAVDVVGQESDISISAPIRSFQHPTYLHYSPTETVGPFNENRVMPATDFFLSGTSIDVMPGFSSPLRSKVAIEIDITPQSNVTITRNVSSRNSAESQPVSSNNTGFYYFNFDENKWNQIGAVDPATGGSLYYDFAIDTATGLASGTFPSQFTFGNCSAKEQGTTSDNRLELGYSKIGSPTVVMGAPSLPKYHATSSQSLKLSNLISSPFMLEAVTVDFGEIIAQRTNGGATPTSSPDIFKSGSIRDIDNYVFFMYRQNRANRVIDSVSDVSSSSRYLVCSASMTFFNSASLSGSGWSPATLLHSPAFSYEFGLPYNDSYQIGSYTGSVSLNMRPAICGPQQLGVSRVPALGGTGTEFIQNSWGGGSTLQSVNLFGDNSNFVRPFDKDNGETIANVIERAVKIDSRTIRKFGGEAQDQTTENLAGFGLVSITTPQSNESPYLLFPEDEIIFGLEAGIPQLPFAGLFSNITGSHLRVGTKSCKVTLYGSLVKDNLELLPFLNQNLSSNSVHEIIGAEPVLDQFQIEPISSYHGSYLDEIVTGSMATPQGFLLFSIASQDQSRRVISRVSLGQAGATGSLQRFLNLTDSKEAVYDSCLPDYSEMLDLTFEESEYKFRGESVIRYIGNPGDIYESGSTFASSIKQFPFEGNPKRRIQKDAALLNVNLMDIASDPLDFTGTSLDPLNVAFLTRYAFISKAPGIFLPDYTAPIYLIGHNNTGYDLSRMLVSSYFFTGSADGILYDVSGKSHNLDLSPGSHTAPATSSDTPVPNLLDDGSLIFPATSTPAAVKFVAATAAISDHKMIDGANDTPFTLSITFKTDAIGAEQTLIERSKHASNPLNNEYRLFIDSSGKLAFRIFKSGAPGDSNFKGVSVSSAALPTPFLSLNEWYNVTVTYNGKKTDQSGLDCMKIFVNGNNRPVAADNGGVLSNAQIRADDNARLLIAAAGAVPTNPSASTEFTGLIHSTHIWKGRQLVSEEIEALSEAELTGVSNGVIKHRSDFGLKNLSTPLRVGTYRYGISNINQEFSSVRISPFHFGYVRDTLEQRRDTAFVALKAPVSCKFISGSSLVSADLTHAQNISAFATSSLPYFDDDIARNRQDNPDDSLTV